MCLNRSSAYLESHKAKNRRCRLQKCSGAKTESAGERGSGHSGWKRGEGRVGVEGER